MKKTEIVNFQIVYDQDDKLYGYLKDVGNAREKGHRGNGTHPPDELSYTFVNLLTGEKQTGICECSGTTACLRIATREEVSQYLNKKDATLANEVAELKLKIAEQNLLRTKIQLANLKLSELSI